MLNNILYLSFVFIADLLCTTQKKTSPDTALIAHLELLQNIISLDNWSATHIILKVRGIDFKASK